MVCGMWAQEGKSEAAIKARARRAVGPRHFRIAFLLTPSMIVEADGKCA
jgi:hypothetical protein